jgi:hypothetical protein
LEPNNKANRLKASFIESAISGEVHRPQRTGPEKSHLRNGNPLQELKVLWGVRIGQGLVGRISG